MYSYFLSFGCRVETVRTHYKRRANTKTYTTLFYISVLLVSVVRILSICHFPTVFPEIFMEAQKAISSLDVCSTFSLLVVEWKLCAHTTSDVQTSKHTQRYTILACCWYHWCEYCRFVIFQLFFLKYLWKLKNQYLHQFLSLHGLFWLSSGNCAHTLQATCKHQNVHNVILY